MLNAKKYPRPDKLQIYPGMDVKNKLAKMAKDENRTLTQMATIIIHRAVKDVKLDEN